MSDNPCGLTLMTCGALTGREAGEIIATLKHFDERFDALEARASERHGRIDQRMDDTEARLKAGDVRFHADDVDKAERKGAERLAMWIGRSVLVAALGGVTWFLTHVGDQIIAWFFPPKH